jgi:hypothetical protein
MSDFNPQDPETKARLFLRLKHSLQGLAVDAESQLTIHPPCTAQIDELALDYDHWFLTCLSNYESELSTAQLAALRVIDRTLDRMSGMGNSELWTPEALRTSTKWENVRRLAHAALKAFNWPIAVPPPCPDIVIGSNS